jgi:hypothetical protein
VTAGHIGSIVGPLAAAYLLSVGASILIAPVAALLLTQARAEKTVGQEIIK